MDSEALLRPEIQRFIAEKTGVDASKLALLKNPFPGTDYKAILNQVELRAKSKDKLPTWFSAQNIIYPSKISLEQTSSEITAKYKASLVSGVSLIDLTGGFGVDDHYFAKRFETVVHCEINGDLSGIVSHNCRQLHSQNIQCMVGDSHETLQKRNQRFDWIYIDPSRRNDAKGKVFMLADCLPDVPGSLNFYFGFCSNILIKTAPILDISAGLVELNSVKNIHIVAVNNEVKELLWELEKDYEGKIAVKTVNFTKTNPEKFDFQWQSKASSRFGLPEKYLYEANAAIMKSGGFNEVSAQFGLEKLHAHSHLYTSGKLVDFPGRIFEIRQVFDYNASTMKSEFRDRKMNITTRNFPETVANIRKKWKIGEGGNDYAFFTTDANNDKIVLLCAKLN